MSLRPDLPPVPHRMRGLKTHRGYPVPFFVAEVDGVPDFRVSDARKLVACVEREWCWLCGQRLGSRRHTYVIGPMCAVNRVSAEPPSHRECAEFAAVACPFLTRPDARRRTGGIPGDATDPAGCPIKRNPGVALVWTTKTDRVFRADKGLLWDVGEPESVRWLAEGREATREEVEESLRSGLPALAALCRDDADREQLERLVAAATHLLPAERKTQ